LLILEGDLRSSKIIKNFHDVEILAKRQIRIPRSVRKMTPARLRQGDREKNPMRFGRLETDELTGMIGVSMHWI